MKIGFNNNEGINLNALCICAIALYLMAMAIGFRYTVFAIILLCFAGISIIFTVIRNIQNIQNYILINNEAITLYRRKKPVKRINLADVKSIVLVQYIFSGRGAFNPDKCINTNTYIVLNDGAFFKKEWTKSKFRKRALSDSEGWIAIEFSFKRYAALTKLLPNCEEEKYTLTGK